MKVKDEKLRERGRCPGVNKEKHVGVRKLLDVGVADTSEWERCLSD